MSSYTLFTGGFHSFEGASSAGKRVCYIITNPENDETLVNRSSDSHLSASRLFIEREITSQKNRFTGVQFNPARRCLARVTRAPPL